MSIKAMQVLAVLVLLSSLADASNIMSMVTPFKNVAYALGYLMMVLMGLKWILADSANDRAEAKKGMIYIVIGLVLVKASGDLVKIYCDTAAGSGITITC